MKIHIATDHAGFEIKAKIIEHLTGRGFEVVDHGAYEYDPDDDYPEFIIKAAEAVAQDQRAGENVLGIIMGGSGNGEQIMANKVHGIRAALVWSQATAELARQHNDANIISIGVRQHDESDMVGMIDTFIATPFSGAERYARRIIQMNDYEDNKTNQP